MSDRKYPQLAWSHWYAWYPVLPVDDSIHWLEAVYRRKDEAGRWVYRSFRPKHEQQRADMATPLCPGA
ncbi:hypothetical protein LJR239_005793 [Neorhizobium tomejilense]|uniref:hypothetical protein n=1 Tax=Neorhizobium sp. T25_13 TaxID=2093830 RepID=UPI000CF84C0D|nr:hypothetical protein [Neorhizobium sp. T25_13]